MPVDIRINEVETDLNVVDAETLLTPAVRDQIVREVLRVLEERMRSKELQDSERLLGSDRRRDQR